MYLRNVGELADYTASYPREYSLISPLWESKIQQTYRINQNLMRGFLFKKICFEKWDALFSGP